MIVSELDAKHATCSVTIESAEDLWTLRRLISKGDVVVTRSSRVVKIEDEYSRPDKGERVKVTIALAVEEVHLDSSVERIRLRGKIVEASDESVTKAGSHTATLSPGHSLTLRKARWSAVDTQLLRPQGELGHRFILVAADRRECGVGVLSGSHLGTPTTVDSGLGGKMTEEQTSSPYVSKVAILVAQTVREGDQVVVAGPGNFKGAIANAIRDRVKPTPVTVLEGFDLTGSDGVRALIKAESFQAVAKGSLLVSMQKLVAEAVRRISMGSADVAYTLPRVKQAAAAGAVGSCIVSDDVFSIDVDEEDLVTVLNEIEARRGSVYMADSSLELGKQVSSFGGVVALLRYALRA